MVAVSRHATAGSLDGVLDRALEMPTVPFAPFHRHGGDGRPATGNRQGDDPSVRFRPPPYLVEDLLVDAGLRLLDRGGVPHGLAFPFPPLQDEVALSGEVGRARRRGHAGELRGQKLAIGAPTNETALAASDHDLCGADLVAAHLADRYAFIHGVKRSAVPGAPPTLP